MSYHDHDQPDPSEEVERQFEQIGQRYEIALYKLYKAQERAAELRRMVDELKERLEAPTLQERAEEAQARKIVSLEEYRQRQAQTKK